MYLLKNQRCKIEYSKMSLKLIRADRPAGTRNRCYMGIRSCGIHFESFAILLLPGGIIRLSLMVHQHGVTMVYMFATQGGEQYSDDAKNGHHLVGRKKPNTVGNQRSFRFTFFLIFMGRKMPNKVVGKMLKVLEN